MSSHPHAHNMLLYAQDAAETDKPWERWGFESTLQKGVWIACTSHPDWAHDYNYRRKPRTVTINGREVELGMTEAPSRDSMYLSAAPTAPTWYVETCWMGYPADFHRLKLGMVYAPADKDKAIAHGQALGSFVEGV